jgi:hypothetical protein
MTLRLRPAALAAALAAAALSAAAVAQANWTKVDELPGGIAVEMDAGSKAEQMDGVRMIERATFRKQLPTGTMETGVSVDCAKQEAKIRSVKLTSDGKVLSDNTNNAAQYAPIHPGSAEAMYYKALCGKEVADGAAAQ